MILQQRIALLVQLGEYMNENGEEWQQTKAKACSANPWFVPEFVEQAGKAVSNQFLQKEKLEEWAAFYNVVEENLNAKTVGVVMAGNIPMVGFHDFLCVFISGHDQAIKLSSKDDVLLKHLVKKMYEWDIEIQNHISFADKLKGCDAFIATGSNNSGRYFEYYFGKYPNVIRKNRTSVAILNGRESIEQLESLADDIQMYFGLGCRNVTKLYVPKNYQFEPLLKALDKYQHFMDYHKYRHNYDYQLALLMMGNRMYMTNGTILVTESKSLFTPISVINYEFYTDQDVLKKNLKDNTEIQCIVGSGGIDFGEAQTPLITSYADGIDTMRFLCEMK